MRINITNKFIISFKKIIPHRLTNGMSLLNNSFEVLYIGYKMITDIISSPPNINMRKDNPITPKLNMHTAFIFTSIGLSCIVFRLLTKSFVNFNI